MTEAEREAALLGMAALDGALRALGRPPVEANPDLRFVDPVVGDLPNAVLERVGAAPFRFVFGLDLDVWVGPFSEVVQVPISRESPAHASQLLERVLRSVVTCDVRPRSTTIALISSGEPWLRLVSWGAIRVPRLEARYEAYASL